MATYTTYNAGFFPSATGVHHEDLVDLVTILDSFQTPLFSSSPKIRARDVVHSWTVDTLSASGAGAANILTAGNLEGSAFNSTAITGPARLMNATQIFRWDVEVSDREREANPAGIRDMYEHQVMKGFKELARQCEARLFAVNSTGSASGAAATNPLMAGIRGFSIITAASASGGVTTADITTLGQNLLYAGAEPDSLWFAPPSKKQFVNATISAGGMYGVNIRNIAASDKSLVANIDVYETPYGQLLAVITDRFIPCTTVSSSGAYYVGSRDMAKIAFFRPPQHKPMGKAGDSTRGIVLMECTLQLDHPSSWAAMTGVTNA